jgi:hypothetical protein
VIPNKRDHSVDNLFANLSTRLVSQYTCIFTKHNYKLLLVVIYFDIKTEEKTHVYKTLLQLRFIRHLHTTRCIFFRAYKIVNREKHVGIIGGRTSIYLSFPFFFCHLSLFFFLNRC